MVNSTGTDRFFKFSWALLAITVLLGAALFLAQSLKGIVILMGLTLFITYLLLAPVNTLEFVLGKGFTVLLRWKPLFKIFHDLPRIWLRVLAILMVYMIFGVSVLVFSVRFVPVAFEQLVGFSQDLPHYVHQSEEWLLNQKVAQGFFHQEVKFMLSQGMISVDENEKNVIKNQSHTQPLTLEEKQVIREKVFLTPTQVSELVKERLGVMLQDFVALVSTTLTGFVYTLTGLVLVFYFLLDGVALKNNLVRLFSGETRKKANLFLSSFHEVMFGYTKAHVVLGVVTGVFLIVMNAALGIPYGVFLGLFFAIAQIIPVVGPWIGLLPWLLVFHSVSPAQFGLAMTGIALFQLIKDVWLSPRVMGHVMGLHPVIVILSLLVCAKVAGVVSILFAIPLASMVNVTIRLLQHGSVISTVKK